MVFYLFWRCKFYKNKLLNFSHQEYNNEKYINDEYIINNIKTNIFFSDNSNLKYIDIKDNNYLPGNYEDLLKFSNLYKMTNKIIDCFMFYNELDMLKFRLDYLYDTVHKFILVESTFW